MSCGLLEVMEQVPPVVDRMRHRIRLQHRSALRDWDTGASALTTNDVVGYLRRRDGC
jgi:hypothetical protein